MKSFTLSMLFLTAVVLGENVNVHVISETFSSSARKIDAPIIEQGATTKNFKAVFLNATQDYLYELVNDLYRQATVQGRFFTRAVDKIGENLQHSIRMLKDDSPPDALDNVLNMLTEQLKKFIDLIPGNVLIKRMALPELPVQQSEIHSTTEMRSLNDLFVNLAKIVDGDIGSLHGCIDALFLEGWNNSRLSLNTLQEQLRAELLNGSIMDSSRNAVTKVYEREDLVKEHVEPDTWAEFEKIGGRIIEVSNDIRNGKNR